MGDLVARLGGVEQKLRDLQAELAGVGQDEPADPSPAASAAAEAPLADGQPGWAAEAHGAGRPGSVTAVQMQELMRFRDQLERSTRELVFAYESILEWLGGAAAAPAEPPPAEPRPAEPPPAEPPPHD